MEPNYEKVTGSWLLPLPDGYCSIRNDNGPILVSDVDAIGGLPMLPSGRRVQLVEEKWGEIVGSQVWRAAGALCRWLLTQPTDGIRDANVLELGAGIGASGLFTAGLGASQVLLTDGEDDLVPLLEKNVHRNADLVTASASTVSAAKWRFGEVPPGAVTSAAPFDWVIGSDITYACNEDSGLLETLQWLLREGLARRCVIAHEHRREYIFDVDAVVANEPSRAWDERDVCLGRFLEAAACHGLVVAPLALERGQRHLVSSDPAVVRMTTDLSVFEVSLDVES